MKIRSAKDFDEFVKNGFTGFENCINKGSFQIQYTIFNLFNFHFALRSYLLNTLSSLCSAIHTFSIRKKNRIKIASKLFHFSNFCEIVQNHSVYKYFYSLAPSVKCDDYIGRKNHQVLGSYRHGP